GRGPEGLGERRVLLESRSREVEGGQGFDVSLLRQGLLGLLALAQSLGRRSGRRAGPGVGRRVGLVAGGAVGNDGRAALGLARERREQLLGASVVRMLRPDLSQLGDRLGELAVAEEGGGVLERGTSLRRARSGGLAVTRPQKEHVSADPECENDGGREREEES